MHSAHWKLGLAVLMAGLSLGGPSRAKAADWMFEPSYYSHVDSPAYVSGIAPNTRGAYRPALAGAHPRFAIRGGYRYNNIVIFNGHSFDRTLIREAWGDVNY